MTDVNLIIAKVDTCRQGISTEVRSWQEVDVRLIVGRAALLMFLICCREIYLIQMQHTPRPYASDAHESLDSDAQSLARRWEPQPLAYLWLVMRFVVVQQEQTC